MLVLPTTEILDILNINFKTIDMQEADQAIKYNTNTDNG